jgi:hypothetical protein
LTQQSASSPVLTTTLLENSQRLSLKQKQQLGANELSYWAEEFINLEHGGKFSFANHTYLIDPYQDNHKHQVHMKATQVGLSTFAILKAVHSCIYRFPLGVMYFFPTDSDVSDFSRGRVTPLIENNPEIIGEYVADTDTVGIKRIGRAFIYFRGMKSKVGMKSVPADMVVFDELDEAPPEAIEMARKRMSHSQFQEEIDLSNPTIPGYGIDLEYQLSDQRSFLLKCPHCGEWNCVEDDFPDCLLEAKGSVILACHKCRKELDRNMGEWVPRQPSIIDVRGYRYSQLISPTVRASDVLKEFRLAQSMGRLVNFYNLTLGRAYVTAKEKLEQHQVLALCDGAFPADPWGEFGDVAMGVDQGSDLHVVFKRKVGDRILTWFTIEKDFEELDKYMDNCSRCVIDALPETRKAREFAMRNNGKVFLNFYVEKQKGQTKWDEEKLIVQENRTESMDASHLNFFDKTNVLPPRSPEVEEFAKHICAVAKKLEEDEDTGSKRYIWVKLGPDHFRHADNYANIALQEITGAGSGGLDYV